MTAAERTSPPASQSSDPALPRRAALAPQPVAGVAYWLLAGVVKARLAGVETEVFFSDLGHEYIRINAEYTT